MLRLPYLVSHFFFEFRPLRICSSMLSILNSHSWREEFKNLLNHSDLYFYRAYDFNVLLILVSKIQYNLFIKDLYQIEKT
jgi:hypothetical protein